MQILNVPDKLIEHRTDARGKPFCRVRCHYAEAREDNHNGYGFFRVPEEAVRTRRARNGRDVTYLDLNDERKYPFHYTEHGVPKIKQCTTAEVKSIFDKSRSPQANRDQIAETRAAEAEAQTGINDGTGWDDLPLNF